MDEAFRVQFAGEDGLSGIDLEPLARKAAGILLAHCQSLRDGAMPQVVGIEKLESVNSLALDEETIRNLELFEPLYGADVNATLIKLIDRTLTPMGGREIRLWLQKPLCDTARIDARVGGFYRLGFEKEDDVEATIDVFDEQKRLRLIYLPLENLPSDATLVCDFLLDDDGENTTTVHLFQSGIPRLKTWGEYFRFARVMWDRRLVKLRKILE